MAADEQAAIAVEEQPASAAGEQRGRPTGSPQHRRQKRPPVDGPNCPACNNPTRDADRLLQHMRKCCVDLLPAHLHIDPNPSKRRKGLFSGQHAAPQAPEPTLNEEELQQLLATARQQEGQLRQHVLHLLYIGDEWEPSGASVLDGDPSSTSKLASRANSGCAASTSSRMDDEGNGNDAAAGSCDGAGDTSGEPVASTSKGVRQEADASRQPQIGGPGGERKHPGKGKRRMTPEQLGAALKLPPKRIETLLVRAPKAVPLAIDNDPVEVLYEDKWLLAVAKPPGVCTAPAHRFAGGTMVNRVAGYLGVRQPHVLHRLDMNTSGVLLVAKGPDSARICHEQFAKKQVNKEYLAICIGGQRPAGTQFSVDAAIGPHPHMQVARAVVQEGGQPALTHFEVLSSSPSAAPVEEGKAGEVVDAGVLATSRGACLVRCRPVTGRTHQIRVHLASAGHPLVGDEVYGVHEGPWIERQALHAWRLTVQHPDGSGPITFTAPPPPDFTQAAVHLGLDLQSLPSAPVNRQQAPAE